MGDATAIDTKTYPLPGDREVDDLGDRLYELGKRYMDMKEYACTLERTLSKRARLDVARTVEIACSDGILEERVENIKKMSRIMREQLWRGESVSVDVSTADLALAFQTLKKPEHLPLDRARALVHALREMDCPDRFEIAHECALDAINDVMFRCMDTLHVPKRAYQFVFELGGGVLGSAALWGFLTCFAKTPPQWVPNDVDLWLPKDTRETPNMDTDNYALASNDPRDALYEETRVALGDAFERISDEEFTKRQTEKFVQYPNVSRIARVKNAQVMITDVDTLERIADNFDLPVCGVIWTPDAGFTRTRPSVRTIALAGLVCTPLGRRTFKYPSEARKKAREDKYRDRGFAF